MKKSTIRWRIYKLVEKSIIKRIGRGKYVLGKQKEFQPVITKTNKNIFLKLKKEFPFLDISIWSTKWITQWMLHVPGTFETIIEVEKGSEENVFYFLSEKIDNVFINPSKDIIEKYANSTKPIIIIKNLITDSPLTKIENVQIPAIEKIIVDLIIDTELYNAYQGRDLEAILENTFDNITINKDKLLRYAKRRKKVNKVTEVIQKIRG